LGDGFVWAGRLFDGEDDVAEAFVQARVFVGDLEIRPVWVLVFEERLVVDGRDWRVEFA
jgi:hypothetical protein